MLNVWLPRCGTPTEPDGAMLPFGPALAVIVWGWNCPIANALNDVRPVAWSWGEDVVPSAGADPASTSEATNVNVAAQLPNPTPPFTRFHQRFTECAGSMGDVASAG